LNEQTLDHSSRHWFNSPVCNEIVLPSQKLGMLPTLMTNSYTNFTGSTSFSKSMNCTHTLATSNMVFEGLFRYDQLLRWNDLRRAQQLATRTPMHRVHELHHSNSNIRKQIKQKKSDPARIRSPPFADLRLPMTTIRIDTGHVVP
jgi:hypothetical protein